MSERMADAEEQTPEAGSPLSDDCAPSHQPRSLEEVQASDALVRTALDFLTALFPAADARIEYMRQEEAPLQEEKGSSDEGTGRFEDTRQVPAHPEYLRSVTIEVDERISQFLREDTKAHLATAYARLKIPVILAQEWTRQAAEHTSAETYDALMAQLPSHIIAHLIADQFAQVTGREAYRFARHGEPQSDHDRLADTIVESLGYMDKLTHSRVEHQELSHGLVIAPLSGEEEEGRSLVRGCYPEDFRGLKRTPLLTDGYQSALWITPAGEAVELITRDTVEDAAALLERDLGTLSFIAAASKQREGVGIMLRPSGSIMTFAAGQPLFIRRSGVWRGLIWDQVRGTMTKRYGEVGAQVFGVALILTTSGTGGILAIVDDPPDALDLHEKDRVDRARAQPAAAQAQERRHIEGAEWLLHQLLPAGNILDLSRPTLALLAGIDGATMVDQEGRLLGYGAIVRSMQGQSEGARTAAARTLSAHGFVIKVSEDGPVQIFEDGEPVLTV